MEPKRLHRAAWIVPVTSAPIRDGGVLTYSGRIIAVGPFDELSTAFPESKVVDHRESILIPPLVNAHTHLELSHLELASQQPDVSGFTEWISALLSLREQKGSTGDTVEKAAKKLLREQHNQGVVAIADIGNTFLGAMLQTDFPGELMHFHEFLGRSAKSRKSILQQLKDKPDTARCTAHAPYSTHPELIQLLKERSRKLRHPFPIHVAEPDSEQELLCCGSGELYDFLRERQFIDSSYQAPASIDKPGSVRYLHDLGILDELTVCVHCVHVDEEEVSLLAESGARVCLCPGSNRYLHVGKAPAALFLRHGILPALGTDSGASNPEITIWREMRLLSEDSPDIEAADIFAMATLGGAAALHINDRYGSIETGKSSSLLIISCKKNPESSAEVYDLLVRDNTSLKPQWIDER